MHIPTKGYAQDKEVIFLYNLNTIVTILSRNASVLE